MHNSPPTPTPSAPSDFSFMLGGPLFQLFRRGRLTDDSLGLLRRRLIVIVLVVWLPLLVFSAMAGQAWGPSQSVPTPFLRDFGAQIRALIALPMMIIAELLVHQRIQPLVNLFRTGGLVPKESAEQLEAAVASAVRLRTSIVAELLIVAFVYVVVIGVVWNQHGVFDAATWFATPTTGGKALTTAGTWYAYVSLPIFQFLLLRWYFRLFIWVRFLRQVSRIELAIIPTHPDGAGGLGFLALSVAAFLPFVMVHGVMLAGLIANAIFYGGATLPDFKIAIAVLTVVVTAAMIGPLFVFSPQLARAKRKGIIEYGELGQRYVHDFDAKWLRGGAPLDEPLVGSADVQSLADLGNSLQIVTSMAVVPLTRALVISVVAAVLLPVVPLVFTMMPLSAVLKLLMGMGM